MRPTCVLIVVSERKSAAPISALEAPPARARKTSCSRSVRRLRTASGSVAVLGKLTEREQDVFRALAGGASNAEIGASLFLSETTIKTHVGRILAKLRLRDRVQAVVLAYESGVIVPGDH